MADREPQSRVGAAGARLVSRPDRRDEKPIEVEYVSRPLSHARAASGGLVLGVARGRHVDIGISDDPVLAEGDRLIVLDPAGPFPRRPAAANLSGA